MKTITLKRINHKQKECIALFFPFDNELKKLIKNLPTSRWTQTHRCFIIDDTAENLDEVHRIFNNIATIVFVDLYQQPDSSAVMQSSVPYEESATDTTIIESENQTESKTGDQVQNESLPVKLAKTDLRPKGAELILTHEYQLLALKAYVEMMKLKNYSQNSIKTYKNHFLHFLNFFAYKKPSLVTKAEIMDYLVQFRNKENWSSTLQNQRINAIKFFFEKLLNKPKEMYDLPRAKKEFILPTVFSEGELRRLIMSVENIKHRTMLCLAYSAGLRISEIVNLKLEDIDKERMVITLRAAKGKKDRQVMLSDTLHEIIKIYYNEQKIKPKKWLFEGIHGGQYSVRAVGKVMTMAKQKAGIRKKGNIHAIRHSFATHLLESGTDLMSIKDLLGHNSIRTTSIYAHVSKKHISKIQSPLDKLGL